MKVNLCKDMQADHVFCRADLNYFLSEKAIKM